MQASAAQINSPPRKYKRKRASIIENRAEKNDGQNEEIVDSLPAKTL